MDMKMEQVLAKEASRRDVVEGIESTLFDSVTQWNTSNQSTDDAAVESVHTFLSFTLSADVAGTSGNGSLVGGLLQQLRSCQRIHTASPPTTSFSTYFSSFWTALLRGTHLRMEAHDKKRKRGPYMCRACGQAKKNHVCTVEGGKTGASV